MTNTEVLILNTAVCDLRSPEFEFADKLVGKGGLAKCLTKDMPKYTQEQIHRWIEQGYATTGGCGNNAPSMARAGLDVAVGVFLGSGDYDGFDAQGKFFKDTMMENNVGVSSIIQHPNSPTGTTFIHDVPVEERGGIAYFPNANNDFSFTIAKHTVETLAPEIVYYMYSGLSENGDAHNGEDLALFMKDCRKQGRITIVDSHTLTGDPQGVIESGKPVEEYKLLKPILPELDIFFTSTDEAKMIAKTLDKLLWVTQAPDDGQTLGFLNIMRREYTSSNEKRTRLFGVTCSDGAYYTVMSPDGEPKYAEKVKSRFMPGEVVDLVGAGDSFRAGLLTYIAKNLQSFKDGTLNLGEAVQMGNLFAALFIKAPLNKRYGNIRNYATMLEIVKNNIFYKTFAQLQHDLDPAKR